MAMQYNTPQNKAKATKLVKQSQGTATKILTMIENDIYCVDIIQQIDSVIGLLKSSKKELLAGHLDHCLVNKMTENKDKTIQELLKLYKFSS